MKKTNIVLGTILVSALTLAIGCSNAVTDEHFNDKTIELGTPNAKAIAYPGVNYVYWDGVKNAKITCKVGSAYFSRFSLIGKTNSDVDISDIPQAAGGDDLIINPKLEGDKTFNDLTPVLYSLEGRAYYVPSASCGEATPAKTATSIWKTGSIDYSAAVSIGNLQATTANMTKLADNDSLETEYQMAVSTDSDGTSKHRIYFTSAPNFTNLYKGYPSNCIWFQPLKVDPVKGGKVTIAFCVGNMGKNEQRMCLYRIYKNAAGTAYLVKDKIEFTFLKGGSAGNGENIYFDIVLRNEDIEGYSFAIGKDTANTGDTAGFVFLKMAGVSEEGNADISETGKGLSKIDFVENTQIDFENYELHKSHLSFEFSTSSNVDLYFNALSDGKTHYAYNPTTTQYIKERLKQGFTLLKMDLGIDLLYDVPGALSGPIGMLDSLKVEIVKYVGKNSYLPRPEIDSMVLKFTKVKPKKEVDFNMLINVCHLLFENRVEDKECNQSNTTASDCDDK